MKRLAKTAFRNISRNMRRSVLSGAAIAVAAMSIVMLFALIAGMSDDMAYNLKTYYTGEVRIKNARFEEFEKFNPIHLTVDWQAADRILSEREDVESYVPRITFPSVIDPSGANYGAVGVGADFSMEKNYQDLESVLKAGKIPEAGKNEALMGASLAAELGLKVGDKFTIMTMTAARSSNAATLTVAGLAGFPVGELNSRFFLVPLDRAQYILRMDGDVQEVLIKLTDGADADKAAASISADLEDGNGTALDVRSWTQISTTFGFLKMAQMIYNFIAAFFFILGSTVIINTTMMVIYERMREIGTLSALGMKGKELVGMFFMEGAFISAIGSAVGVAAGIGITLYLGAAGIDFTDAMSGMDFEISSILYPSLKPRTVVFVYIYAVAIASLATLIPSRKASKIQPVEALRYI